MTDAIRIGSKKQLKVDELTLNKDFVEISAFKADGAKGFRIRSPWFAFEKIDVEDE